MELWINGKVEKIDELMPNESTIADLLKLKGWQTEGIAVEINAQVVPQRKHVAHNLQNGDKIEVVTLIGGG